MKQILITIITFVIISCGSPYSAKYYYTQQSSSKEDKNVDNGWTEEESNSSGEDKEPTTGVSIFSIIGPNGNVNSELLVDKPEIIQSIMNTLPKVSTFSSTQVKDKLIRSKFTASNVPVLWYIDGTWSQGNNDKNEFINNGPNTTAGSNSISNVNYYSYQGLNPFFKKDSSYNTIKFSENAETRMERFVFYRFTGDTALPKLDNFLVAVDTYTKLFYSFAIPLEYKTVFGEKVPIKWGSVDTNCTDSSGKKHKFYEYDPAGYVDDSGEFFAEDWYKNSLAKGNYNPVYTGKSPYSIKTGQTVEIKPTFTVSKIEDGILHDSHNNKYYTELTIDKQANKYLYKIYRLDDRSSKWLDISGFITVDKDVIQTFKDYNSLSFTKLPRYKVEVYNSNQDLLGESDIKTGSRMLTNREILLLTMESLRKSFTQLWYKSGSFTGDLSSGTYKGNTGSYYHGIDRNGFFGTNYRRYQRYNNFSNGLITIDGTFMKDNGGGAIGLDQHGTWTHSGSNWPYDNNFNPKTTSLTVTYFDKRFNIMFNNIYIDNNSGNSPLWKSGSFNVSTTEGNSEFTTGSVPFALFMDKETFLKGINYTSYIQE